MLRTTDQNPDSFMDQLNTFYNALFDTTMWRTLFQSRGFCNVGYWSSETTDPGTAAERLVELTVQPVTGVPQSILDVACGVGATTHQLARTFPTASITGINISEPQLRRARTRASTSVFLGMNASQLAFADESFDVVVCIEAAFHFRTRQAFLGEALRVLKPNGSLLLTDVLYAEPNWMVPVENIVSAPEAYHAQLLAAGFVKAHVRDIRTESWQAFYEFLLRRALSLQASGEHPRASANLFRIAQSMQATPITHYLVVAASKAS